MCVLSYLLSLYITILSCLCLLSLSLALLCFIVTVNFYKINITLSSLCSPQSVDHGVVVIDTVAVPGIPSTRWVYATRPVFLSMDPSNLGWDLFVWGMGLSSFMFRNRVHKWYIMVLTPSMFRLLAQECIILRDWNLILDLLNLTAIVDHCGDILSQAGLRPFSTQPLSHMTCRGW